MATTTSREDTTATTIRHAPTVAWQRLGDEVVVLDMAGRTLIGLDNAGAALWEAIGRSDSLDASLDAVAEQFEQPVEAITNDLLRFTQQLVHRGLLVTDSGGATKPSDTSPVDYEGPFITWEEPLEEAGVFAGCAKDPFGEGGSQCLSNPSAGTS